MLALDRWRLVEGLGLKDLPGALDAWNGLWAGACAAHDRFLRLENHYTLTNDSISSQWRVGVRA